ncbi:F-box protein [Aspergillus mulundensis]|uniref:F-box domain-containing protein n=1 Tax=Aspergillus mulundensis TaxID=1810919 RepID=A0A3D8RRX1_9EURO|nr:hypothetical protein DSM5745_06805 [Aspergillus mulundensis]RDW76813.1 hypothetical protein DSM5745_06805 [Aspergillus mulundensis]
MSRPSNAETAGSNTPDHTTCPNCNFVLPYTTKTTDPARRLPFDCMSLVLQQLDIVDILRCERLNQTWRDFVQTWIHAVGLHLHFPDAPEIEQEPVKDKDGGNDNRTAEGKRRDENKRIADEKGRAVKLFKDTAALLSGKPTAVRTFQASSAQVALAGNCIAWFVDRKIYWKDLSRGDKGSLQRAREFRPRYYQDEVEERIPVRLWISDEGDYILVRTQSPTGHCITDHLFHPWNGKEIWYHEHSSSESMQIPLVFGEHRIYYFDSWRDGKKDSQKCIATRETETLRDSQRYRHKIRDVISPLVPEETFRRHLDFQSISRRYIGVIHARQTGDETFLAVGLKGTLATGDPAATGGILLVTLTRGNDNEKKVQEIQVDMPAETHAYIQVSASTRREFALITHDVEPVRTVTIRKFRPDADGKFEQRGIPTVIQWPGNNEPSTWLAIDPFKLLFARSNIMNGLDIGSFTLAAPDAAQSSQPAASETGATEKEDEKEVKRRFGLSKPVTLPPKDTSIRSRRRPYRFLPDQAMQYEHAVHFVDPGRIIVEIDCAAYGKHRYTYRILDFGKIK